MAKSVCLPFEVPTFATVQNSGAAELAMIGHDTAFNQVLNQCTNIRCTRNFLKGYTSPQVSIPNVEIHCYKFMERNGLNCKYIQKYCMEIIKSMLDDNMYVYYTAADDFYLPGKSWYGTRHMHHDGVICGYDDNDNTISIAAHDINWVYNLIRIPQKNFLEALNSSFAENKFGTILAYRVKENTIVQLNESEMLKFLKEYMNSDFEKYPTDIDGPVLGIVVHNYLAIYIDKLKDGSIPQDKMDWRALRPIWEHKKCMLKRIQAIEDKNGWNNELSSRYAKTVDKANRIRIMYAMYHKNSNNNLLDKIHDGLLELAQTDEELVGEFIRRLEELIE